MAIPSNPLAPGAIVAGKTSWFGGSGDSSDSGHTASGIPETTPGIAVYNQATLGGWWRVKFPNGRVLDLRQTDLGPAPWTGKAVDILYSALGPAGYTQSNFPTGAQVTATYLGKGVGGQPPTGVIPATGAGALSGNPPAQASATGAAGSDLFGAHHSELLYATVWVGALAIGAWLLFQGLDRTTHGSVSRTVKGAAKLGTVVL